VQPVGAGRFVAELGEEWNCPFIPQGGIVAATAARAMTEALGDPSQSLRSLSGVFAGQVRHGPVEIEVTELRRGRTMSQLRVAMRSPGADAGFDGFAVFGAQREGYSFTDAELPEGVKPPLECPSHRDPEPEEFADRVPFAFWEQIEGRPTIGHPPWEAYEPTTSLRAQWYRFDDPPRADDGTWDPLALVARISPSTSWARPGATGCWV
jgi:acyl-CoA thioesterase